MTLGPGNLVPFRRGEGGGGGSMEGRVASLEAHMATVRGDVSALKSDVRDIRERLVAVEVKIDHLPSKGFIITVLGIALSLGVAALTFADKLQAMVGAPSP